MTDLATHRCCLAPKDDPEAHCDAPADALVIAGCVHEHIIRNYLCLFHLSTTAAMDCRSCWLSAEPHRCAVQVHEVTR